jgi:hypothetical protein
MPNDAKQILDRQFLEMRWRCLSLAADIDRIQRASGGSDLLKSDARLKTLHRAIEALNHPEPCRAVLVQMRFSDMTPPPDRKSKIKNQK